MLVLAYGGDAPAPQAADLSLSETRLRLFDSYVARMLQRQARRDHNVAFDDVRANDVPVSRYRHPPDAVNRWLGWLALTLSVRMRTSVAPDGIVRLLMIAKRPQRQFLNFWVAHAAVAIPVALCLAITGAFLAPPMPSGWWTAGAMVGFSWVALPVAAAGCRGWGPGIPIFSSIAFGTALLGVVLVALVIATALLSGVSPLVILPACTAAILTLGLITSGSEAEVELARWTLGAVTVAVLVTLAYREWFAGASVTIASYDIPALAGAIALGWVPIIICLVAAETPDSLWEAAVSALLLSGVFALVTALAAWMDSIHWMGVMTFLAGAAISLCAVDEPDARRSVPTVMAMSAVGVIGSIVAGPLGAAAAMLPMFVLSMLARRLAAWKAVEDYVATWIENVLLSRCAWRTLAMFRCFPMKRRQFFRSAADAFLLKVSGQDYEFVHRLLRDHFALRQLLPKLRSGEAGRFETILALGYQGESALDLLVDLARNGEPKARAAAISALRHIPSLTATQCFRAAIDDRDPDVRFALIRAILELPSEECIKLFKEIRPLGDGTEMKAFVSLPSKYDSYLLSNLIVYEDTWLAGLMRTQLDLVGLETLLHYLQHGKLLERCRAASFLGHIHEPRVVDALLNQVGDREPRIRVAIATALGGHCGDRVRAALETLQFDRKKDVRTAAAEALHNMN
jgi:HEAT repeat protein